MVLEAKQARTHEQSINAAALARWAIDRAGANAPRDPIQVACDCPKERLRVGGVEHADHGVTLILVEGELGLDGRELGQALARSAAHAETRPVDAVFADPFGELIHFGVAGLSSYQATPTITVETRN